MIEREFRWKQGGWKEEGVGGGGVGTEEAGGRGGQGKGGGRGRGGRQGLPSCGTPWRGRTRDRGRPWCALD